VANSSTTVKRGGLSRGKVVLIAVLAVVLVGVLYLQFGGSGGATPEPKGYVPRRTPAVNVANASPATTTDKITNAQNSSTPAIAAVVDAARWKSPDLANVVDYDPFALPATFPKPKAVETAGPNAEGLVAAAAADDEKKKDEARAQLQSELQALKESGVQVIVREGDQYVAMIGDRTLRVGEDIGGFTVTGIDPGGVVVEKKASQ
jgi:hypothetical protein